MTEDEARAAFDELTGAAEWAGICDPWDKDEERGEPYFAGWMREDREPTCLDCGRCARMPRECDASVRAALGHGLGFCRKYCEWVTDEDSAEELGNVGVCYEGA